MILRQLNTKLRQCLHLIHPELFRHLWPSRNYMPHLTLLVRHIASSSHPKSTRHTLEFQTFEVRPFGKLKLTAPFDMRVQPIDPVTHPLMDVAFVMLYANRDLHSNQYKLHTELTEENTLVIDADMAHNIHNTADEPFDDWGIECHVHVPVKFDICLSASEKANVSIESMESNKMAVTSHQGNVCLRNIKTDSMSVHSKSGNIEVAQGLQGNIELVTGNNGSIVADKLQGVIIDCSTDIGNIDVQTVYGETSRFSVQDGNVHLGSAHGDTCVTIQDGDLKICSLDGSLNANIKTGSADVQISRHQKVNILTDSGDVTLRLPDTVTTSYIFTADTIGSQHEFENHQQNCGYRDHQSHVTGTIGKDTGSNIEACTKSGNITLLCADWLSLFSHEPSRLDSM